MSRTVAPVARMRDYPEMATNHVPVHRAGWPRVPRATVLALATALVRLAVIGLFAIAASGVLAFAMGRTFGRAFVSGDVPGVTYTQQRCAELREYAPGAGSCEQAAVIHHFGEVVAYRIAAGVLGVFALLALVVVSRWLRARHLEPGTDALPAGFVQTVGSAAFGLAAAGLLAVGASQLALGRDAGAGQFLSAGVVALAVAVPFGISLASELARRTGLSGR
jgi:hypothetical protein